jgi:signal transduction histidine kinase
VIREISEHKRSEEALRASGEQMRDFAAHVEAVLEDERTRVAREIHDELGQAMTALKIDLAWLQRQATRTPAVRKKMKQMAADVDDTIQRVRRISTELRPAILDDLGLVAAIEWQLEQFRKHTRIRADFVSSDEIISISRPTAAAIFRVVQEALTNVMRHARATRVSITLDQVPDTLLISILDNGVGMARTQGKDLKSLGIVGMRERITRLGGDFKLLSRPGKGTRLEISIPKDND